MADQPPISFRFGPVRLLRDVTLGTGAYGQVCKAMLGELPCAAKLLHPTIIDPTRPNKLALFEQECRFLSEIRHPNIVQYLGVAQDRATGLPILLMEMMDDSLTHFLELSEARLSYHVQVNINYDIAKALSFLHTNQIVHRDLSSNNVLLIGAGVRAKVTDFGMSKLTSINPHKTRLTACPGTPAYMSPEALLDPPIYTEKLDCFQAGVLMVQIITRKFPDPGDAMHRVRDERSRTGWINMPVPETERRDNHLRLVTATHPMFSLAVDCLKDTDTERPSAQQICHRLSALKETLQYRQSLEAGEGEERQYTCHVSGPGLQSATANHPTHVIVEVTETSGRPCTLQQNVTAELEPLSKATPTSPSSKPPAIHVPVATASFRYEMSYTAVSRGQHKLHVRLNDKELNGSPFTITVYPDPTQLGHPVRVVTGVNTPYGIVFNSRGEMIVSECQSHQISIFDIRGQRIRTFGSRGNRPEQMECPAGIAIDDTDNIYVCSEHKLQKFTSSGELIKCIGQEGSKEGEFNDPRGVTLYNSEVYVSDSDNHRIQVFDLDLNFIRSIWSRGKGRGELDLPLDIKFDSTGNMYITDYWNHRVQVLDSSGHFIRLFGQEGEGRLEWPASVFIADQYVYVSDIVQDRIVVYKSSGQFVTSFGGLSQKEGQLSRPFYITSCTDGYIYVSDFGNNIVQIF